MLVKVVGWALIVVLTVFGVWSVMKLGMLLPTVVTTLPPIVTLALFVALLPGIALPMIFLVIVVRRLRDYLWD